MIELSKPFEVGKTYTRLDGKQVTCIKTTSPPGYQCAQFDDREEVYAARGHTDGNPLDSGFRYNRGQDRGRCTASKFDDPFNVIPEANPYLGEDHLQWLLKPFQLTEMKGLVDTDDQFKVVESDGRFYVHSQDYEQQVCNPTIAHRMSYKTAHQLQVLLSTFGHNRLD